MLDPRGAGDYTSLLDVKNSTKRLQKHYDHDVLVEAHGALAPFLRTV